ncbi:TPA: hypothetical protein ACLA4B_001304, partial [Neisseria meningitidis]
AGGFSGCKTDKYPCIASEQSVSDAALDHSVRKPIKINIESKFPPVRTPVSGNCALSAQQCRLKRAGFRRPVFSVLLARG